MKQNDQNRHKDRASCEFAVTVDTSTDSSVRDASPAAAADASKCPIFDFEDEHCIDREFAHKTSEAAPTWYPAFTFTGDVCSS